MVSLYGKENFPSPVGRTGGAISSTARTRRTRSMPKPKLLFATRNMGTSPMKFPKKETPPPAQPAKSITMRYKQLKEKLKAIQNLASNRSRRSENNARELRQLVKSQQNSLIQQIKQQDSYMHRFSRIRGTPTSYYNRNFRRFYRAPVQRGLAQYYYYQQPGVPRYVQQLPARVLRLNQGGRGLPPAPFYTRRRR